MTAPHLRPLGTGEILDRAFSLYRSRFGPMLGTSLALFAPVAGFQLLMGMAGSATEGAVLIVSMLTLVAAPLWIVSTFVLLAALTYQSGRTYMGQPASTGESLRQGFARFFPLFGALIITGLAIVAGLLAVIVGAIFVWIVLFAVIPAVVIEKRGPMEAVTRSVELARGAWGPIFLVLLVAWIIASLPGFAVQTITAATQDAAAPDLMRTAIGNAIATMLNALTYPFSIAANVILYYDRRVRAEGLDVQLATGLAAAD